MDHLVKNDDIDEILPQNPTTFHKIGLDCPSKLYRIWVAFRHEPQLFSRLVGNFFRDTALFAGISHGGDHKIIGDTADQSGDLVRVLDFWDFDAVLAVHSGGVAPIDIVGARLLAVIPTQRDF